MTAKSSQAPNRTRINLLVDSAIFAATLAALSPRLTGLAIHEWLSLALGAALITHLVLHWQWLAAVIRKFLGKLAWNARLNLVLNTALFIAFVFVIFSGLLISRQALPVMGVVLQASRAWEGLHRLSANLVLLLSGLHVAVHWKWILNAGRRYLVDPLRNLGAHPGQTVTR